MRHSKAGAAAIVALAACLLAPSVEAAEGGSSYFFPGAAASFLVAVPPQPGFAIASQTLIFNGSANAAVLRGRASFGIDVSAIYEYLAATYTFGDPVLGGRLQIGAAAPVVAHAKLKVEADTALFGTLSAKAHDTDFGDMVFPISLTWNFGEFNLKLAEAITAPTGHYDVRSPVNVGRNYWGFDTQLGLTWFSPTSGMEVSVLAGLMINTKNPATDYKTGSEFHLDFMVNQFLSPSFALGAHGYWYKQIEGDSGRGAALGAFKGEAVGIGPAVLWVPGFLDGKAAFVAKWLFDLSATNRLKGNWGMIALSYGF